MEENDKKKIIEGVNEYLSKTVAPPPFMTTYGVSLVLSFLLKGSALGEMFNNIAFQLARLLKEANIDVSKDNDALQEIYLMFVEHYKKKIEESLEEAKNE